MKQAKSRTYGFRAWLSLVLLCLSLILYSPSVKASAPPDVPETGSSIVGRDFTCILYYPYCFITFICCTNPGEIIDGDIRAVQQVWMLDFWNGEMIIRYRQMADMWTQAIVMQARMIGGFFDAQNHHSAQLSLQRLQAQALRDYMPDETLCQFGTAARSLAASDALGRRAKIAISERAQNRQVLSANSNSANTTARGREPGRAADKAGRLSNFITTFCNNADENFVLDTVCQGAANNQQYNRDIDYARTFGIPMTLDTSFGTGGTASLQQAALFELNSNLYGHNIIANRPNPESMAIDARGNDVQKWMDYRSVVAKRSVAQNSFASIAAMKAPGTNASYTYLRTIMQQLGMTPTDIDHQLGTQNPSYYAQMEILSKRIYQNPGFYAHLMQKPANVLRTQAALGAISLMQERDIAESMQRSEMLLSTLLELNAISAANRLTDKATQ